MPVRSRGNRNGSIFVSSLTPGKETEIASKPKLLVLALVLVLMVVFVVLVVVLMLLVLVVLVVVVFVELALLLLGVVVVMVLLLLVVVVLLLEALLLQPHPTHTNRAELPIYNATSYPIPEPTLTEIVGRRQGGAWHEVVAREFCPGLRAAGTSR